MRRALFALGLALALCGTAVAASPGAVLPADEAMQILKAGNLRHVARKALTDQSAAPRPEELKRPKQQPFATILACSDSHAPLEIIFDLDAGDVFSVRVAGNLAGPNELGSIEYGVGRLGTPVVLVLGHTSCGVVAAAMQPAKTQGGLAAVFSQIRPAVAKAREWSPNASGDELLTKSVKANVWLSMEQILRKSQETREHVQAGRILLVGGVYDLDNGQVAWLGQHPDQGRILASAQAPVQKPRPRPKPKAAAETPAEEQGGGKAEASDADAAAVAEAPPKPAAKQPAKSEAKPAAKQPAKASAKPAVEATATQEANPNARSEGEGELLAPAPDKAPAKAAKGSKAAHQ